jgi:hypothetical protein
MLGILKIITDKRMYHLCHALYYQMNLQLAVKAFSCSKTSEILIKNPNSLISFEELDYDFSQSRQIVEDHLLLHSIFLLCNK